MTNPDDPAFPRTNPIHGMIGQKVKEIGNHFVPGLTKREYFASLAMEGLIGGRAYNGINEENDKRWVAEESIGFTDALIAELNKK